MLPIYAQQVKHKQQRRKRSFLGAGVRRSSGSRGGSNSCGQGLLSRPPIQWLSCGGVTLFVLITLQIRLFSSLSQSEDASDSLLSNVKKAIEEAAAAAGGQGITKLWGRVDEGGKPVTCVDPITSVKRLIPGEWINDDYCDCSLGEDEPHTGACSITTVGQKKFACRQERQLMAKQPFEREFVFASRLGDGVCDCCDGSDEAPAVDCPDVCPATAATGGEADSVVEKGSREGGG